jgi:hypothetical protein
VASIDFPDDLIELERSAWQAQQAGTLTAEQAAAVQQAITAFSAAAGHDRYDVEMGLKHAVRHADS